MNLLDFLFGCWHRRLSFPLTPSLRHRRTRAARLTGTYVVCLDCGREFPYDLGRMTITDEKKYRGSRLSESARCEEACCGRGPEVFLRGSK